MADHFFWWRAGALNPRTAKAHVTQNQLGPRCSLIETFALSLVKNLYTRISLAITSRMEGLLEVHEDRPARKIKKVKSEAAAGLSKKEEKALKKAEKKAKKEEKRLRKADGAKNAEDEVKKRKRDKSDGDTEKETKVLVPTRQDVLPFKLHRQIALSRMLIKFSSVCHLLTSLSHARLERRCWRHTSHYPHMRTSAS